jgi:hypothetical protein
MRATRGFIGRNSRSIAKDRAISPKDMHDDLISIDCRCRLSPLEAIH